MSVLSVVSVTCLFEHHCPATLMHEEFIVIALKPPSDFKMLQYKTRQTL